MGSFGKNVWRAMEEQMASQIAVTIWDQHNSDFKRQNPLNDSLCFCLGKSVSWPDLFTFYQKIQHMFSGCIRPICVRVDVCIYI